MQLNELRDYIESELAVSRFRDYCPNGVQIEGRAEVRRIATGVTASQAVLEAATAWGADAILVHHGYFWRNEDAAITGIKKRRVAHLLKHDVSLLAYHLPLDAHPDLGNNAQLGERLGFVEKGSFGEQDIAMHGVLAQPQTLQQLARHIQLTLQHEPQVIGHANPNIERIAWCSGAAQGYFEQAVALGVDAFLTGEISEQNVHVAQESGVAFIAAGHHATERFGIQALGEHLADRFGLEHRFFDQDIPV
ncbi:MAG: Nif3-like dinuclear metal center hexameric protein [Gammaproteobacteria bacterium]|nr:Nif3-like dinuclear metal center hexameric protein [Gammaproteobacteria bacterium]MBU1775955.1 Nif3-like dinuclear metal center hexameric protein [Gammaproteobacteria bacterium]MBU1968451.1 Nif3-like dinuclear metal center hexameric protein [Gammaproteobacteria bacterium]